MSSSKKSIRLLAAAALLCGAALAASARPQVVPGPGADPDCFKPWDVNTKYFQAAKKNGPYRIALVNGFIGDTWRIQMIKTAKAYVEQPSVRWLIKDFRVVSTGENVAAQAAAVDNFINSGYDAVIVDALDPSAFAPEVAHANAAGVALLSFDNVIESPDAVMIDVDQVELGRLAARWLLKEIKADSGNILEVRGVPGNSVDRDRHNGFHEVLDKSGRKFKVIEVIGKWFDATAQKVTADAIAEYKRFVGIYTQSGSIGTVRALINSGHPMIPVAGETENGFRKLCAQYADKGLHCFSAGTGPAQVAVAIKAAIAELSGEKIPQAIALPISHAEYPNFKPGKDYYPDLSDNFFVGNAFPACNIGFTATEIMGKSAANQ